MKVSRKEVIQSNLTTIRGFIPDIRTGDSIDILDARVGDRVTVVPDWDLGEEGAEITIVFKINAVMAVTKGADISEIAGLLATITQGTFGALGTGMGAFGAAGTGMAAGAGIAGATLGTLKKIMAEPKSNGDVHFQAKMTDVGGLPNAPLKVSVTSKIAGHTGTNDNDSDEIAIATNQAKILTKSGLVIKSENIAQSKTLDIDGTNSTATDDVNSDSVLGVAEFGWILKTDGAFSHDTVSMVQISTMTMVLEVEA